MARFVLTRRTPLPAELCWERVTDWPGHGRRVPFTRVAAVRGTGQRVDDRILARTGVGMLGFDDPMDLVEWVAPAAGRDGVCRLEKRGRVVRGWAVLTVRRVGPGSEVRWEEEISVPGLPRLVDPLLASAGRAVFGRVLADLVP
ncbi:hypothetical protein CFP65_0038 [Kitasatospora sp. MMS16-BH015]|uniref:SRPBCC family protein n=1 Tax=Kitasatospora sp. MMS16-BH015 TaxID=2018025 RepID=UPI000CA1872C|nr:SRPBCC family protein [Kitasatospora sp. MMS16-BH015]AUG75024.1 hypothetical protein CFP65_0038 [Kitasatospora sp. MMS16-BH015]